MYTMFYQAESVALCFIDDCPHPLKEKTHIIDGDSLLLRITTPNVIIFSEHVPFL